MYVDKIILNIVALNSLGKISNRFTRANPKITNIIFHLLSELRKGSVGHFELVILNHGTHSNGFFYMGLFLFFILCEQMRQEFCRNAFHFEIFA